VEEKELRLREKVLVRLILKAALKKKERLEKEFLRQSSTFAQKQNMN